MANTCKKLAFHALLGSALLCAAQVSSAGSVLLGEQIVNGGFGTNGAPSVSSWTTTGTIGARSPTSLANVEGGNSGFDSFFDSSFAILGDTNAAIGGSPNSGSSTISQTFTLPPDVLGGSLISYDLAISFFTVFDGDGATTAIDAFSATLNGISLFAQDSSTLPDCATASTCPNNQIVLDPFSLTLTGLTAGTYTLTFTLVEASGTGTSNNNTGSGIDNVSIIATAQVPEPATVALLGLGLLGLLLTPRMRRKVA